MNKIILILSLIICFSLASCSQRQSAINDLRNLTERLEKRSQNFSEEDWQKATDDYSKINDKISKNNYSDKEMQEIGELRGKCSYYFAKGYVNGIQKKVNEATNAINGAVKGFEEAASADSASGGSGD
jgi:outer membrane protein assembly factor BamD (BamD/ComL family)